MTLKTPFRQFSFKMFYLEAGLPDKEDEMKRVIKDQKWEMGAQSRKGQYNFSRKTRKFVGLIIFEKTIKTLSDQLPWERILRGEKTTFNFQ